MTGPWVDGDWRRAVLPLDSTVEEAIRCLDESHLQIVLVVDRGTHLIGTLTDGDIRRGLLHGIGLGDPIGVLVQREPVVVSVGVNRDEVHRIMEQRRIHEIPIVDDDNLIVGLAGWSSAARPVDRINLMVVMAGGEGTRLRPLTENCPKPLLPVGGRPMLEHILERAIAEGFKRFVFAIRYLGHMIEDHFGDGGDWGVEIDYIREGEPLGTVGALSLLEPGPGEPFIVSNGDVLTAIRYGEMLDFHVSHDATATMAVRLHEWQHPFGVVHTEGVNLVGFEEKPVGRSHVNAGVYALDPSALSVLDPEKACDMPTLFNRLHHLGRRTIVYPLYESSLDIGRLDDYMSAQ
jgi:dTDP-glucose pyrophosphorylase